MIQTPLQDALKAYEEKHLSKFKPSKTFYEKTNINRIRFSKIVSGKKPLLAKEAKVLSEFFGIPLATLL